MKFRSTSFTMEHIFVLLILIISAFPILPYVARSVVIILMVIIGFLLFISGNRENELGGQLFKWLIISLLPFIALFISLLYSEELEKGINRLIQMIPLLVFPILFYSNSRLLSKKVTERVFNIFAISVIILVLYQIMYCLINLDYIFSAPTELELKSLNLINSTDINENVINQIKLRRFRSYIIEITDSHTTYQGLWIALSLAIIFKNILKYKHYLVKTTLILLGFVLMIWLLTISARGPLVALILGFFAVLITNKTYKVSLKTISILIICASLGLYIVYKNVPGFNVKVKEVMYTKFELPTSGNDIHNFNSTNVRYGIYYCSFEVFRKNILLGVGIGDLQKELNNCYKTKIGAKIYTWRDYNTHNQYLFFFLSSGILGLLLFLLQICFYFRNALKRNYELYFYFVVIICLTSITENIFSRSDGVMFFSLFSSLFLFNKKHIE